MPPPSRKKVKPPPTNDTQSNHHEASEKAPPHREEQTQQDLNLASKTMHTITRTSTHRSIPPSYATSNATLDETILEGHRRLRKSLDDMKAELQRREAAKQNGEPMLRNETQTSPSGEGDEMLEADAPTSSNDQPINKSDQNSAQMQIQPRRYPQRMCRYRE